MKTANTPKDKNFFELWIISKKMNYSTWLKVRHSTQIEPALRLCYSKSLYTCNSIYVNQRNEIKKGGPHTTFRDRGAKVHPSGALYFVKESHAT